MLRMRTFAMKMKIAKRFKDSVAKDLEILEKTTVQVDRRDMHHSLSGSWAHRVETTDFIKPSESTLDLKYKRI